MFVDYYALLEVDVNASSAEIKAAFKRQAMKWHPDKNPGVDTTEIMQKINEAKLMLLDSEARVRYDKEYLRFKEFKKQNSYEHKEQGSSDNNKQSEKNRSDQKDQESSEWKTNSRDFDFSSYEVSDDILLKWIRNARKQAVSLAQQTIEDIRGMSSEGGKAIGEAVLGGIVKYIVFGVIITIIMRACN